MKEGNKEKGGERPDGYDYIVSPVPGWRDAIIAFAVLPPILTWVCLDSALVTPLREKLFGPRT